MQQWKPKPGNGIWIGLSLLLFVGAALTILGTPLVLVLVRPPQEWDISPAIYSQFVMLVLLLATAGFLLYRVAGVLTLSYEVDRNGLYIRWLGNRAIIPIDHIERIDTGDKGVHLPWRALQGIGYYWGQGVSSEGKPVHFFSTISPARTLFLHTNDAAYAISPNDMDGFVQHLEQRRRLGAVKPLARSYERGHLFSYSFWKDRTVQWTLALAAVLNLLLLGVVAARYPDLAAFVEMRFDATGLVAELRPRHQVLFLPLAAFGLMVFNLATGLALFRREQAGARMLQVASVLVLLLFGVATLRVLGH